jgi:hypothetical protein
VTETKRVWQLVRPDGELLAELVVTDSDFPWLNATIRPTVGFEDVRPLFVDELRWLHADAGNPEQWDAAYERIRAATRLLAPDGHSVPEFLLHIDGDQAWWRWLEEPFTAPGPGRS